MTSSSKTAPDQPELDLGIEAPGPAPLSVEHLPQDLDKAAEACAELLWNAGLRERSESASEDPYTETSDIHMSGRDGAGADFIDSATKKPWLDLVDDRNDPCDYIYEQCETAFESLFDESVSSGGALRELWAEMLETLLARDEDFDENAFKKLVSEHAYAWARDCGADSFFEIEHRLTGSVEGTATIEPRLARDRGGEGHSMIPDWSSPSDALDWAETLMRFNIHPADFANSCRAKALGIVKHPADADEQTPESCRQTKALLAQAGLSRRVGRDPSAWSAGLRALAQAWSRSGASLPKLGAPASVCVDDLVDLIDQASDGYISFEFSFGLGSDELSEHSELIDRFGSNAPVCLESLSAQTMIVSGPTLTVDGNDLDCAGQVPFHVDELSWTDQRADDENTFACMAARRGSARKANELSWMLRAESRQDAAAASEAALKRVAKLAAELGSEDISAFEWALKSAGAARPDLVDAARAAFEQALETYRIRLAKLGKGAAPKRMAARVEDFDIAGLAVRSAPWRGSVRPSLAWQSDSLGNTLAHKACAGRDAALLAEALAERPELATLANISGTTPIDLICRGSAHDRSELARAFLKARPDLAASTDSSGRSFMGLACLRGDKLHEIEALLDLGCSLSDLSRDGTAPWSHWAYRKAPELRASLAPALARGWSIDSIDGQGRSLAHCVSTLDSARALVDLGADFSLRDRQGRPGGCSLRDSADLALLEREILERAHPQSGLKARVKTL